ncbi:MAG: LysM peptidoglycan-binding domain-containing protein [Myxococcales bacterium]|nr:LysM peptidoglycan-binding domain-containing protein [Myxococcales bacterium]
MKTLRIASFSLALAALPGVALAQIQPVTPGVPATPPAAPAAPPPAAPRPIVIPIGADGLPILQAAPEADSGFFYDDEVTGDQPEQEVHEGQTPDVHVVRTGDTLWDICGYYFNDSWQWPKVWGYNAQIKDAHWIYPGDAVRLLPEGASGAATTASGTTAAKPTGATSDSDVDAMAAATPGLPAKKFSVTLRQTAFVSEEALKTSMTITGSNDDKTLMVSNDEVYIKYDAAEPPTVGKVYSIFEVAKRVKHPGTGKQAGAYVTLLGDVEITSVRQDKFARGYLRRTTGAIERGAKIGPLARQFKTIDPVAAKTDLQGVIVAMFSQNELIGSGDVVFLDVGADAGLEVGNRMYVIRRGDMLRTSLDHAGINDKRYPARILGELVVVETGKTFAVAVVTLTMEELGVSDIVVTQTGQ